MHTPKQLKRFSHTLTVILTFLLVNACATIDYKGVQVQFEQAAREDYESSGSTFTESSVFTGPGYADVVEQLAPEYIDSLDERLRSNAYLLRSVSLWRMGQLDKARESARKGLEQKAIQQSRDHVLLMMIPGLVIDSEIALRYRNAGEKFNDAEYQQAAKDFETAFDEFDKVERVMGPATPESSRYYLYFQRYRVVQNWRTIINHLVKSTGGLDLNAQNAAIASATNYFDGQSLVEVAQACRDAVPVDHPLRQRMEDLERR